MKRTLISPFNYPGENAPRSYTFDLATPQGRTEYKKTQDSWRQYQAQSQALEQRRAQYPNQPVSLDEQADIGMGTEAWRQMAPAIGAYGGALAATSPVGWLQKASMIPKALQGLAGVANYGAGIYGAGKGAEIGSRLEGHTDPKEQGQAYAIGQAIAIPLAKGVQLAAKPLMASALGVTKALGRKFPGIENTALQEGIGPSASFNRQMGRPQPGIGEELLGNRTTSTGAEAARIALERQTNVVNSTLSRHDPTVQADIGRLTEDAIRNLRKSSDLNLPAGREQAAKEARRILDEVLTDPANQGIHTATRVHRLKQALDRQAQELYDAIEAQQLNGVPPDPAQMLRATTYKKYADVLRDFLRKRVPGYGSQEGRMADISGLFNAMREAEAPHPTNASVRMGEGPMRANPGGLLSPHAKGVAARAMHGPVAGAIRTAPFVGIPAAGMFEAYTRRERAKEAAAYRKRRKAAGLE